MRLSIPQLGMVVGIISLTFFFVALMLAFGLRMDVPAPNAQQFAVPHLLWVGTTALLMSSLMIEAARHAVRRGHVQAYRIRLSAAVALAILFLVLQGVSAADLMHQGVPIAGNPRGSAFYVFMGIHGLHLCAGVVWFVYLWFVAAKLRADAEQELRRHRRVLGAATLFWHFMGGLWVAMFFLLRHWAKPSSDLFT